MFVSIKRSIGRNLDKTLNEFSKFFELNGSEKCKIEETGHVVLLNDEMVNIELINWVRNNIDRYLITLYTNKPACLYLSDHFALSPMSLDVSSFKDADKAIEYIVSQKNKENIIWPVNYVPEEQLGWEWMQILNSCLELVKETGDPILKSVGAFAFQQAEALVASETEQFDIIIQQQGWK